MPTFEEIKQNAAEMAQDAKEKVLGVEKVPKDEKALLDEKAKMGIEKVPKDEKALLDEKAEKALLDVKAKMGFEK
eukprot:1580562-Rhodomonas_salina.1